MVFKAERLSRLRRENESKTPLFQRAGSLNTGHSTHGSVRCNKALEKLGIDIDYQSSGMNKSILDLDPNAILCSGHNGKTAHTVDSLNEKLQAFDLYGIPSLEGANCLNMNLK